MESTHTDLTPVTRAEVEAFIEANIETAPDDVQRAYFMSDGASFLAVQCWALSELYEALKERHTIRVEPIQGPITFSPSPLHQSMFNQQSKVI